MFGFCRLHDSEDSALSVRRERCRQSVPASQAATTPLYLQAGGGTLGPQAAASDQIACSSCTCFGTARVCTATSLLPFTAPLRCHHACR